MSLLRTKRSSKLPLPDGKALLLATRLFFFECRASIVVSPPKRVGFACQNGENVSKPLSSEGGSSLKIMIRRVQVYNKTSSQPLDVIIAPDKQRRASDGGFPVIAAIRAEASGSVQIT